MKLLERRVTRRSLVAGSGIAAAAWAARPFLRASAASDQPPADFTAVAVDRAPIDPEDPAWVRAKPFKVNLLPQNLVLPRLTEAGTKALDLRVLYDAGRVAFLLEWMDAHRDTELGTVTQYRDGVAVMFPEDPTSAVVPSYTMGNPGGPCIMYHWKSDWQFEPTYDVDQAYPNMYSDGYPFSGIEAGKMAHATDYLTQGKKEYLTAAAVGNSLSNPILQRQIGPVQKMRAEGFGTIQPDTVQDAQGKGVWKDGVWRVAMSVPREQAKFSFTDGLLVPLAFAAWDGSRRERNGQKGYAPWSTMAVGSPATASGPARAGISVQSSRAGNRPKAPLIIGGAGTAVLAIVSVFLAIRMRRPFKNH